MGIIAVVGIVNVYLLIPTFFIGVLFYYTVVYYLSTSRSIKRLEGVCKCRNVYLIVYLIINNSICF